MKTKKLFLVFLIQFMSIPLKAIIIDGIDYEIDEDYNIAYVTYDYADVDDSDDIYYPAPTYSGNIIIKSEITYNGKNYPVTRISYDAFLGSSITSVTIPSSVTSIYPRAFNGCTSLTSVIVKQKAPISINSGTFPNRANATLYVPAGSKDAYEAADYWNGFKEIVEMEEIFTALTAEGVEMTFKVISESNMTCMVGTEEYGVASIADDYSGGITIPSEVNGYTVTRVGKWALCGRSGLTSVSIPETVTSIGTQAFNFTGLTSVTLPNKLESLEDAVFQGCRGLKSITIPQSVTSISEAAFENLNSIVVEAGNTVYDSRNNCNAVIKTSTNELIISSNNTVIPNTVTRIGNHAFIACADITSILIPSSVTSIGHRAFWDCSSLTSVTIPASMTYIDGQAFANCPSITSIVVAEGNSVYDSRDNCNAIIETSTNKLIQGCKNTIIPNSVTSIGGGAFYCCSPITSMTIPESVTSIGGEAFRGTGLTSVIIPENVESIGFWAFQECHQITSVTVKIPVPIALSDGGDFSNHGNATLYVPAGSKAAYEAADYWKDFKEIVEEGDAASEVVIDHVLYRLNGEKTEAIAEGYADDFSSTTEGPHIQTEVTIEGVNYPVTTIGYYAFMNLNLQASIDIPEGIKYLCGYAFWDSPFIQHIKFPSTLISMGGFGGIGARIESVSVAEGNPVYDSRDNCNALIETATNKALIVCDISTLPTSVTSLGGYCLYPERSDIINIPNYITHTDECFLCSGVNTLNIPATLTSISAPLTSGHLAQIDNVHVDENNPVYFVDGNCIIEKGTNKLIATWPNSTIPTYITGFGRNSLYNYSGVVQLNYKDPPIFDYEGEMLGTVTLQVPAGTIPRYLAVGWTEDVFKGGIVEIAPSVNIDDTFIAAVPCGVGTANLTFKVTNAAPCEVEVISSPENIAGALTIPATVTDENGIEFAVKSIADHAFAGRTGLTSVLIADCVETIGGSAFDNCQNLKSVTMPANVISFSGFYAFGSENNIESVCITDLSKWLQTDFAYGNNPLRSGARLYLNNEEVKNLVIPEGTTSILTAAFEGCESLTAVVIPSSVTSIGSYSFANCPNLTSIKVDIKNPLTIDAYTFTNRANATLYVPIGSMAAYQAADVWMDFKEIVEMGTDISQLDNVVYIEPTECRTSSEFNISIKMKNSAAIRGFQFDLYLPEGVTAVKNAKGRILGSLSNGRLPEDDAHTLTITEQTDGAIRFLCGSQYDETFTGTDGEIATLTVQVADDMAEGVYPIIMRTMKLTETDISKFYETALIKSTLTVSSYIPGDINGDNKVDVSDYIGVANHIMGNTPTGFNVKAADVDGNGIVDVSDYIGIANFIMTGSIYGSSSVKELLYKELEAE